VRALVSRPFCRMKPHSAAWAALGFVAFLALGCSPESTKDAAQNGGESQPESSVEAGGSEGAAPQPSTGPTEETKTEEAVKKLMTTPIATEESLKIKPSGKAPGYKPSSRSASLTDLGKRVDQAITKLPPAMVNGRITFSTGEGELMGKVDIKVKDSSTFRVQYNMPKLKAEAGSLVGDGRRFAEKTESGWKLRQKEGGSASPSELQRWPLEFTSMMFMPLTDSKVTWQPLFDSWQKKGAKVEERPQELNGKKKMLYRVILAEKDSQMEVILDGERMLPLTVRSDVPRKGGGRDRMMWTGQWAFGGSHQASDFLIPIK